jgi:hypothetical protein
MTESLGRLWIEDPSEDIGSVLTRPYIRDSGLPRRSLGTYQAIRRYKKGKVRWVAIQVAFDDGAIGIGAMPASDPGWVEVYSV